MAKVQKLTEFAEGLVLSHVRVEAVSVCLPAAGENKCLLILDGIKSPPPRNVWKELRLREKELLQNISVSAQLISNEIPLQREERHKKRRKLDNMKIPVETKWRGTLPLVTGDETPFIRSLGFEAPNSDAETIVDPDTRDGVSPEKDNGIIYISKDGAVYDHSEEDSVRNLTQPSVAALAATTSKSTTTSATAIITTTATTSAVEAVAYTTFASNQDITERKTQIDLSTKVNLDMDGKKGLLDLDDLELQTKSPGEVESTSSFYAIDQSNFDFTCNIQAAHCSNNLISSVPIGAIGNEQHHDLVPVSHTRKTQIDSSPTTGTGPQQTCARVYWTFASWSIECNESLMSAIDRHLSDISSTTPSGVPFIVMTTIPWHYYHGYTPVSGSVSLHGTFSTTQSKNRISIAQRALERKRLISLSVLFNFRQSLLQRNIPFVCVVSPMKDQSDENSYNSKQFCLAPVLKLIADKAFAHILKTSNDKSVSSSNTDTMFGELGKSSLPAVSYCGSSFCVDILTDKVGHPLHSAQLRALKTELLYDNSSLFNFITTATTAGGTQNHRRQNIHEVFFFPASVDEHATKVKCHVANWEQFVASSGKVEVLTNWSGLQQMLQGNDQVVQDITPNREKAPNLTPFMHLANVYSGRINGVHRWSRHAALKYLELLHLKYRKALSDAPNVKSSALDPSDSGGTGLTDSKCLFTRSAQFSYFTNLIEQECAETSACNFQYCSDDILSCVLFLTHGILTLECIYAQLVRPLEAAIDQRKRLEPPFREECVSKFLKLLKEHIYEIVEVADALQLGCLSVPGSASYSSSALEGELCEMFGEEKNPAVHDSILGELVNCTKVNYCYDSIAFPWFDLLPSDVHNVFKMACTHQNNPIDSPTMSIYNAFAQCVTCSVFPGDLRTGKTKCLLFNWIQLCLIRRGAILPMMLMKYWVLYLIIHLPSMKQGLDVAFTEVATLSTSSIPEECALPVVGLLHAVVDVIRGWRNCLESSDQPQSHHTKVDLTSCPQCYLKWWKRRVLDKFGSKFFSAPVID